MTKSLLQNTFSRLLKVLFAIYLLMPLAASAQEKCASHLILEQRNKRLPHISDQVFEHWIQNKTNDKKMQSLINPAGRKAVQVVQISVVFHIIHKGDAIGVNGNLSKERIDRQLETLNEDFNLANANRVETLADFSALAADIEIEFVYARQDPEGFETNGINRLIGSQLTYSFGQRATLTAESYWPAENYLNIWITDVTAPSLGWAEFPIANLPGLGDASGNRLIDGVTIDYEYIGDNPESPVFESKGRTLTHEVGHFFGLRHIWGDGGCAVDDYCDDTPEANSFARGCDLTKNTCTSLDMVQNFMDYTDDACMTLFTQDQKNRMRIVVENSPRRLSLTISPGLEEPLPLNRDLALYPTNPLFISNCDESFTPSVRIKNQGLSDAQGYTLELLLNGNIIDEKIFGDTIPSGNETVVSFDSINFSSFGSYEFAYRVKLNSQIDERISNNEIAEFYQQLSTESAPFIKDFTTGLTGWLIQNPDDEESWEVLNGFAGVPLFDERQNLGEKDRLISPIFDLTNVDIPALNLVFAQAADTTAHQLTISASYDCGATFTEIIYQSQNTELATAYNKEVAFIPENRLDWDSLYIDLPNMRNESAVCFKLEIENRGTDNVYISRFEIEESNVPEKRITPVNWQKVNSLYCDEPLYSTLTVKNTGRSTVTSYDIKISSGNDILQTLTYNEALSKGQTQLLKLPNLEPPLMAGELDITISTEFDEQQTEVKINLPYQASCIQEIPPIRLDLAEASNENWFIFNPDNNNSWIFNNSVNAMSSQSSLVSNELQEDWLISPIVDVSRTDFLSLIFKVAYHKPYRQNEGLEVYLFDDSGEVFETLLYRKTGDSLATSFGNEPNPEPVFRTELIDLSSFTFKENIRVAIKAQHNNGANIFLKDVTFFIGQETPPVYPDTRKQFVVYPNPVVDGTLNLHFNLNVAAEGTFQILDTRGKVLLKFIEPKILNQFVTFNVSSLATGLYLLNFQSKEINESVRFLVD